jgi:hypothetical protein
VLALHFPAQLSCQAAGSQSKSSPCNRHVSYGCSAIYVVTCCFCPLLLSHVRAGCLGGVGGAGGKAVLLLQLLVVVQAGFE